MKLVEKTKFQEEDRTLLEAAGWKNL